MAFVAVAFGGGLLASALLPSGGRRRRRQSADCESASTRNRDRIAPQERIATAEAKRKRQSAGLDAFKGALFTVAASKLGGALGDFLSTYRNEFNRARVARGD